MLTVHLLRAPDYEPGDYFDVCSLLTSLDLHPLQFVIPETMLDDETYNDLNQGWGGRHFRESVSFNYQSPVGKVMYDSDRCLPLSWQELFRVCDFYRQTGANLTTTDVVMLLTNRPNALNWFSAYEGRNVFIHTADWAQFIPSPPAYPIAYQILANILRLQTGLSVEDHGVWRVFHEQAIGCMNDLCQQKGQIALKLRTGDICDACLRQLKEEEVPEWLVETVLSGFEKLRRQMLFRQGFRQTRDPGPVLVNQHHQIIFPEQGNLELAIPTLHRLVYLFFLQHPEGVSRQQLPAYHPELLALYERISGLGDQQIMRQNVDRLTNRLDNSFVEKRTRINTKLVKTLGETLAKPYQITGERGGLYRIGLPRDKVLYGLL